jgi:hypothetical protein
MYNCLRTVCFKVVDVPLFGFYDIYILSMAVIILTAYVLEIQGQYTKYSSSVAKHLLCVIFYLKLCFKAFCFVTFSVYT